MGDRIITLTTACDEGHPLKAIETDAKRIGTDLVGCNEPDCPQYVSDAELYDDLDGRRI